MMKSVLRAPPFSVWFRANSPAPDEPWEAVLTGPPGEATYREVKRRCGRSETAVYIRITWDNFAWTLDEVEPAGAHVEVVGIVVRGFPVDLSGLYSQAEDARLDWISTRAEDHR